MWWRIRGSVGLVAVISLAIFSSARPAQAAIESRAILKSFFQTGDIPTQDQFATLIDSTVNLIDDHYLIGLKVYDPQVNYLVGDTVIFNRLAAGVTVGELALRTSTLDEARPWSFRSSTCISSLL